METPEPTIHKYKRQKISALTGQTQVIYDFGGFRILADQFGIQFVGNSPVLMEQEDLQAFAKAVSDSWQEHEKLLPKIEIARKLPQ